ncbi:MAG: GNAT superfamily N-acetyltransferase [Bacteriovoracaceae bacterium]|jgi:GNAT superfamily N-acetyltransferase
MEIRKVLPTELDQVIALLADDDFGKQRESISAELRVRYKRAFNQIIESEYFDLYVGAEGESLIGCFQIMYLPHVSFGGTFRAQVESVRIKSDRRGKGLGKELMKFAIIKAKENGCGIFQLTSNKDRGDQAHKFYKELGMQATHEGYKLYLDH